MGCSVGPCYAEGSLCIGFVRDKTDNEGSRPHIGHSVGGANGEYDNLIMWPTNGPLAIVCLSVCLSRRRLILKNGKS